MVHVTVTYYSDDQLLYWTRLVESDECYCGRDLMSIVFAVQNVVDRALLYWLTGSSV